MTWASALWGIAVAAFGPARPLCLALLSLIAAGAADMASGIFRMAFWNQTIHPSILGRAAADGIRRAALDQAVLARRKESARE